MDPNNKEKLLDHEYDGIKEYDNPLPNWWLVTFLGAVIFSFVYWVHYEFGGGWTQYDELEHDLAAISKMQKNAPKSQESESELAALLPNLSVQNGQNHYAGKCASCHGQKGEGLIGPNLVDNYWLHGSGSKAGMVQVISEGVLDKGMPAWKDLMSHQEILEVMAFIISIKGTSPPNPKAPQGELVQ